MYKAKPSQTQLIKTCVAAADSFNKPSFPTEEGVRGVILTLVRYHNPDA